MVIFICAGCASPQVMTSSWQSPADGPSPQEQKDTLELDELQALVEKLYQEGEYTKGINVARKAVALSEKTLGSQHPYVALALHNLGSLYHASGEYEKAVPLLQRALSIRKSTLGPDHPYVATTLNGLAKLYRDMGQHAKAEPLLTRALAIQEKALGSEHPDVAITLSHFAELHRDRGDYAQAEKLFLQVLSIREKALGPDHHETAGALSNLAGLYHTIGNYEKAEILLIRAVAISEKALGPDHQRAARSFNDLGVVYLSKGDYTKAEFFFQRALALWEKIFGPEHPYVSIALNNLAALYHDTGVDTKAEPLYQRSLAIREKVLGSEHPDVATAFHNLAHLYLANGDYAKAEPLLTRSLAIKEKALGPEHPDVAVVLSTLAGLYRDIGSDSKTEPLYQRALVIREKALGPEHPAVALALNNLAELYRANKEYEKAEPLYQRALAIQEKAIGLEHPVRAIALSNLASLYFDMGMYARAEPFYQQALTLRERALGPNHPSVALALNNLGGLYHHIGEYAKAAPLYQRALAIKENALGPEHPEVALALSNWGALATDQQNYRDAFSFLKRSLLLQERQIQNVFSFTTEEQKISFVQSISYLYWNVLSLIHQPLKEDPEAVREGLALVLRRKGIVFDAQSRAREVLQERMSELVRKEWDSLSSLRGELSRLLIHKPEKMSVEQYKSKLASLQQQIEESERHLAGESALAAKELQQRTITVEAVAKKLPKNSVLVEFVKIPDYDFAQRKVKPSWRYLAFVLTGEGSVTLVDLGEASALEALAQRALTDIKTSLGTRGIEIMKAPCDRSVDPRSIEIVRTPCGRDAGRQSAQLLQELHAQVWAPLEKALGKSDKVVLSPDGLLNLVPFAALQDSQGRSLVERYQLAYVTSGRELVGVAGALPRPDSDLLLVANPSFDQKGSDAGRQGTALRSREFRGVFTPLPGTERESREIPPLVAAPKEQKQVLVGERATETAVKTARSPRILHLATHGFFLPDDESALDAVKLGGLPDRGITVVPRPASKRYENPLVRSGLAFAGANHATTITDGDDGILTALEITGMDLYGTELVVLSACDTGVGETKTGEGVFGLRRAFALAGVKNLLMSLWEVSDEVTARQMKMFYQNLQKLPKAEALRQAQLETIKELKAQYDGMAPPSLWAPFILQGAQALGQ